MLKIGMKKEKEKVENFDLIEVLRRDLRSNITAFGTVVEWTLVSLNPAQKTKSGI